MHSRLSNLNAESYRPEIDGLRALAIILVITFHYFGILGGYIGVDIFFVISGYLITLQILAALEQRSFSLIDFYARRVRRILPALAFVICACLAVSWFMLLPTDFVLLGKHSMAGALNVSNIVLWREAGYFDVSSNHKPFLHFWSLGIEEQFYLIWPLLLIAFFKFRRHLLACLVTLTTLSFVLNVVATHFDRTFAFYMPMTRFWELSSGGLVAYAVVRNRDRHATSAVPLPWPLGSQIAPWMGFVLILFATAILDRQSAFPGYWALLPVAGTCLMIAPTNATVPGLGFLRSRTAVFIGKISFSLYLWHWPLLLLAHLSDIDTRFSKFVVLALCFLLSWFTYLFIEQPIRKLRVTQTNAAQFLLIGATVSVAIAVVGWMISAGIIHRAWDNTVISRPYKHTQTACGVNGDHGKIFDPKIFSRCDEILYPESPTVILLGDSHALNLYEGLKPYLTENRINLVSYPVLECTPLSLLDKRPRCVDYNQWIDTRIQAVKPALVIIFAHHIFRARDPYFGEPIAYADHLWTQAATLKARGVRNVWIIGGIPNWKESLPHAMNINFLRKNQPVPERTFTYVLEESLRLDDAMRSRDNHSGVEYISLKQALCNERGCLTSVGKNFPEDLLVLDYGHLTHNGARYIAERVLGNKIESLTR